MADEQGMSRAEEIAKRAHELSARAEELANHAHDVAGVDDQLAALETELESLLAEESALDSDAPGEDAAGRESDDEWEGWSETFGVRMEALGDRLGHLMGGLNAALSSSLLGSARGVQESELSWPVTGSVRVRISSRGGVLEVKPGQSDRVHIRAQTRGSALAGGDPPLTVSEHEGTIYIESRTDLGWRPHVFRLEIEVPPGTPVDASTGGGAVTVEGTRAPVRAKTGGGSMTIEGVDGEVEATSGGGTIRVEGRLAGDSRIRTGGGSIHVLLDPATRVEVDARGTMATIDIPGLKVRGGQVTGVVGDGADGRLVVRTGGGSVRIEQS